MTAALIAGGMPTTTSPAAASTPPSGVGSVMPRAADGRDFDPGNIISDAVFFDGYAMSEAQIQAFLNAKGANCVNGEQICLKNYRATSAAKTADSMCAGYAGGQNQSAAQLIAGVAASCGVNPRVLLVLLEKEQSLVTRTRPTTRAYQAATGFGCPDTAPCDTQYYGLFNQLYLAARQYQMYATYPTRYNHVAGRVNNILYHPNASCGSNPVFIANQATAGLYNYTPYQPNAAALANMYGTGNGCSSYGNRNFWRLFSDWFGSPQASSRLMRSEGSATVYLVTDTAKHPIGSMELMSAYSPLGAVSFVSQQYLDRIATGIPLGRTIVDPSGTVYFVDAGIKLPFASCTLVADYGGSCGSLVSVSGEIAAALHSGPLMTRYYRTTSGKGFYVSGGTKAEVADDLSLTQAGLSLASVTLLETGIRHLPYAAPITRPNIVLRDRETNLYSVSSTRGQHAIPAALRADTKFSTLPIRDLDNASMVKTTAADPIGAFVRDENSSIFLLTSEGKTWVRNLGLSTPSVSIVPADLLSIFPDQGSLGAPLFIKSTASVTVYSVREGLLRSLRSWDDLIAVNGGGSPQIYSVSPGALATLTVGESQLGPGSLVVGPANGTVYLIDGLSTKIPLGSFSAVSEMGIERLSSVPTAALATYSTANNFGTSAVTCGATNMFGIGGRMYALTPEQQVQYGISSFRALDPLTCASLTRSATPLGNFVRDGSGTIYFVEAGQKRPIGSWGTYVALGGTSENTVSISPYIAGLIPTGPAK